MNNNNLTLLNELQKMKIKSGKNTFPFIAWTLHVVPTKCITETATKMVTIV